MSETEWIYDYIIQIIKSPEFRNPIKDFIDDNCNSFIGVDESTFEQGGLFKEFILLVEQLLESALTNFGVTEEMFCLAAKKGLEVPEDAKYFEQLIAFNNYTYFKNMMTKRNYQLEELAYNEMRTKMAMSKSVTQQPGSSQTGKDSEIIQHSPQVSKEDEEKLKQLEEEELKAAIKMSIALDDEKRKLQALEEAELRKAIRFSYLNGENKMDKTAEPFIPKELKQSIPIAQIEAPIKKEPEKKEEEKKKVIEEPPKKAELPPKKEEPPSKKEEIPLKKEDVKDKPIEEPKKIVTPVAFPSLQPIRPKEEKNITAVPPQNYIDKLIEKEKAKAKEEKERAIDPYKFDVETKVQPSYLKFESENPQAPKVGNVDLNNKIDQIEQEKADKLKEYREMILKMRKDKRQEEKEKGVDELLEDNDLSNEVKMKLELRRQLADRLKKLN